MRQPEQNEVKINNILKACKLGGGQKVWKSQPGDKSQLLNKKSASWQVTDTENKSAWWIVPWKEMKSHSYRKLLRWKVTATANQWNEMSELQENSETKGNQPHEKSQLQEICVANSVKGNQWDKKSELQESRVMKSQDYMKSTSWKVTATGNQCDESHRYRKSVRCSVTVTGQQWGTCS